MVRVDRPALASLLLLLGGCTFAPGGSDVAPGDDDDDDQDAAGGSVPGFPGAGERGPELLPGGEMTCYYAAGGATPAASVERAVEVIDGVGALHVRLTLDPAFVDNTYGANAIGWPPGGRMMKGGHSFRDLVGSDRAELVYSIDGTLALEVQSDYVSESAGALSGYATLGVTGREGKVMIGDPAAVLRTMTSLDRNLNERGHGDLVIDSPVTDESWSPSPEAPDWDFRVVYETWVALSALGDSAEVSLESIHASPSKATSETLEVDPAACPPAWGVGASD